MRKLLCLLFLLGLQATQSGPLGRWKKSSCPAPACSLVVRGALTGHNNYVSSYDLSLGVHFCWFLNEFDHLCKARYVHFFVILVLRVPEPNAACVPDLSATCVPDLSATCVPDPNAMCVPDPNATCVPDPNAICVPDPNAICVPDPNAICVPDPNAICVPDPSATCVPNPSATCVPNPSATCVPAPNATVSPLLMLQVSLLLMLQVSLLLMLQVSLLPMLHVSLLQVLLPGHWKNNFKQLKPDAGMHAYLLNSCTLNMQPFRQNWATSPLRI